MVLLQKNLKNIIKRLWVNSMASKIRIKVTSVKSANSKLPSVKSKVNNVKNGINSVRNNLQSSEIGRAHV